MGRAFQTGRRLRSRWRPIRIFKETSAYQPKAPHEGGSAHISHLWSKNILPEGFERSSKRRLARTSKIAKPQNRTSTPRRSKREAGYTLAELLIVLLIVGLIAAIAVPNIGGSVKRAEETALRENLKVMRKALDDYIADRGEGPDALTELVDRNYVRFIPDDPVADPDTPWRLVTNDLGDIVDIRSSSDERGSNETPYSEW